MGLVWSRAVTVQRNVAVTVIGGDGSGGGLHDGSGGSHDSSGTGGDDGTSGGYGKS